MQFYKAMHYFINLCVCSHIVCFGVSRARARVCAVSYTHLDVYKRQQLMGSYMPIRSTRTHKKWPRSTV